MTGTHALDRNDDALDRAADPVAEALQAVFDAQDQYDRVRYDPWYSGPKDEAAVQVAKDALDTARAELRALEAESETIPFTRAEI